MMALLQLLSGNRIVSVAILVWAAVMIYLIYRDAQARDAQPGLWAIGLAILGLFLPLIGLLIGVVIYWITRPKGPLLSCPHCGSKYLHWLADCPKCGGPVKRDCHRCREVVAYDLAQCPKCHARL